jgi:hypothetical protein
MRQGVEELIARLKKKQRKCIDTGPIYNSHVRGAYQDGKRAAYRSCIQLLENLLEKRDDASTKTK